jgi:RimJ/RimL family protein N-acetyltransferase
LIQLREPTPDDAAHLAAAVQESLPDLEPWLPWATSTYGPADAARWIGDTQRHRSEGGAHEFFIVDAAGQVLGTCGLNRIDAANRFANLGYWVRSSATGQGVAARAVGQLARWAFSHTELHRLEIIAAVGNQRSQRVAEKAGATREGVLRGRLCLHGTPHDAVVYSIMRSLASGPA